MFNFGESFVVFELSETILLGRERPEVIGSTDFFAIDETIVDEGLVDVQDAASV